MSYDKHKLWIDERLAAERREREARERMWNLLGSMLTYIEPDQIVLEVNPLDLGSLGASYLEQVQILFPEVGPGEGELMHRVIQAIPDLLRHRTRDLMTDEERIQVGWADDPYVFECRACKRRVTSPCNDWAGFHEAGPWDFSCQDLLRAADAKAHGPQPA